MAKNLADLDEGAAEEIAEFDRLGLSRVFHSEFVE